MVWECKGGPAMQEARPDMPSGSLSSSPGLWRGGAIQNSGEWIFHFPHEALAEIRAALGAITARGLRAPGFGKDDFPLPTFSAVLEKMLDELEHGRGFFLMRGFPVAEFTEDECETIFWG